MLRVCCPIPSSPHPCLSFAALCHLPSALSSLLFPLSPAGAWDGVWAGDGSMPPPAEGDTGATGAGSFLSSGAGAMPMPMPLPVSPQVASLQAHGSPGAAATAQQQFNGGVGAALTRGLLAGSGSVPRPLAPPMMGVDASAAPPAHLMMTSSGGSPPGPRAVPAPPPRPPSVRTMQAFLDAASPADLAAAAAAGLALPGFGGSPSASHAYGHGHGHSDAAAHAPAAPAASDDPLSILLARARQLVEEPPAPSGAVPEAFALNGASGSGMAGAGTGRASPVGLGTGHHYDEYHQPLASGASPAHAAGGPVSRSQSGKLAIGLGAGAGGDDRDGGSSSAEDDIGDSASARAGPSAAGAGLALGAGSTLGAFKGSADARKSTFFLSSGGGGAASGRRSVSPSARDGDVGDETASAAGGGTGGHSVMLTSGRKSMRRPTSASGGGLGMAGGANGDAMTAVSGKSGGGKSVITAFTVNTTGVLALPRHTLSAKGAVSRARGMEALLNSFPKMRQYAVREMAFDIAELVARKEAVEARLAEDALRRPEDPPPRILLDAEQQLGERVRRLVKLCGSDGAELVIAAVNDPVTREAMGLAQLEDEDEIREEAGDEDAARVWRRKLESRHVQPLRGVRGESAAALHDDPTSTGGRDLHNTLNRADPAELMSYYQKQQLKYGRGRRGSTSVAGAWEALFGSPGAGADRRGQADGNTGIGRGGDTSRLGGSKAMAMATAAAAAGAGMAGGASGRFSGDRTREYARRAASAPRARALGVGSVVGGGSASGSGEGGGSATMLGEVTHGVRDPGVVSPARQARMVSASPLGGGGGVVVGSGSVVGGGGGSGGSAVGGRSRAASPAGHGSPSASSAAGLGLEGAVAAAASTGDVHALAALAMQLARQVQISGGR